MVEYQRNGWDHHERQQTAAATQDTIEGLWSPWVLIMFCNFSHLLAYQWWQLKFKLPRHPLYIIFCCLWYTCFVSSHILPSFIYYEQEGLLNKLQLRRIEVKPLPKIRLSHMSVPREEDEENDSIKSWGAAKKSRKKSLRIVGSLHLLESPVVDN
jgi:hypothetical protein